MHPFFLTDLAGERIRTFHLEAEAGRRSKVASEGRASRSRLRRAPRQR
jgi:hypothetical protein